MAPIGAITRTRCVSEAGSLVPSSSSCSGYCHVKEPVKVIDLSDSDTISSTTRRMAPAGAVARNQCIAGAGSLTPSPASRSGKVINLSDSDNVYADPVIDDLINKVNDVL